MCRLQSIKKCDFEMSRHAQGLSKFESRCICHLWSNKYLPWSQGGDGLRVPGLWVVPTTWSTNALTIFFFWTNRWMWPGLGWLQVRKGVVDLHTLLIFRIGFPLLNRFQIEPRLPYSMPLMWHVVRLRLRCQSTPVIDYFFCSRVWAYRKVGVLLWNSLSRCLSVISHLVLQCPLSL